MRDIRELTTFEEWERKIMKDPKIRREYEAMQPEFEIARQMIEARIKNKLNQKELAERMGTGQAAVSRLENATGSPSIALLKRLADALDKRLEIRFK